MTPEQSEPIEPVGLCDTLARELLTGDVKTIKTKAGIPLIHTGSTGHETVDLGWVRVRLRIKPGQRFPVQSKIIGGSHYVLSTLNIGGKRRQVAKLFWPSNKPLSDDYFRAFVAKCGIPSLCDLKSTLLTPDGKPLLKAAERQAEKRALRKGIDYEMRPGWFEDLYDRQEGICALSGLPMFRENGKLCHKLPVPDRMDSKAGYVPGNVRLLRHGVNMMRRDMSDADFIEMCRSVAGNVSNESCRFSRKPLVFKAAPAWPLTRTGRERRVKV